MTASYQTLKQKALQSLESNWGLAIGALVVYMVILIPLQMIPVIGAVAGIIVGGPFAYGLATFYLRLSRNEGASVSDIFAGFNNFVPALTTYLLMMLYVILWMLCLIVPGIIALFSYSQVFYILVEEPDLSASEVLRKSKQMMDGHKMDFFVLSLTFIGWGLLCILTCGIGLLWLVPYYNLTMTKFYEDLRGNMSPQEVSIPDVLDAN
jgi:uncharacterized membrane protein